MINSFSTMLKFFNPNSEDSSDILDAISVAIIREFFQLPLCLNTSKDLHRLL